ncbi:MAG: helix-turn-helix transcriptional regulator [Oscillospiraceae bacterium]|nr:helix-turn-helix transcriptional regulator [Oscillospiraceae bacterium]
MTLGEKIRQARLEAGLSQRQLCGGEVTRNMLSQIENGAAKPSMATLAYFASRLGKTVSFFLEEEVVCSPNQELMKRARDAVLAGKGQEAAEVLADYCYPDPVFDAEATLLRRLAALQRAEEALKKGQAAYAAEILEELNILQDGYCAAHLEHQRLLLLAKARPQLRREICRCLPSIDEELILRARDALDRGAFDRCTALLEAAQDQDAAAWNFLRGELHLTREQYVEAAACYRRAEPAFPEKCAPRLERCYRELGDFKQAYFYACKQRNQIDV